MAQNEVQAKASLDTKDFEQGAARMGDHMKKFAFETEGVMSKLARQLSATDIAAAAVFATIAKGQQVVRDSLKAYEDQQRWLKDVGAEYDNVIDRLDAYSRVIRDNNAAIGESLMPLEEYRKKLELIGSSGLSAIAKGYDLLKGKIESMNPAQRAIVMALLGPQGLSLAANNSMLNASAFAAVSMNLGQGGFGSGRPNGTGGSGGSGAGGEDNSGRFRFNEPRVPRYQAGYPRPIGMGGNPFDMGYLNGQPGADFREPARYSEGTPGAFSTFDDYQKYLDRMDKVNQVTQQFGQNLVSTLMDTYARGGNIMKAIGSTIVDTLKATLSELAGQAIGSALSGFIGGALGIKPGVSGKAFSGAAVEPAMQRMAARSIMPGLAYETRRGRGF